MSMDYKDYIAMLGLFIGSLALVLVIAAVVYLLIGYGLVYGLALLGVIEFSHSAALGATLLTFIVVILYQYFVEREAVIDLNAEL